MCTWWVGEEFIGHVGQRQDGDHAVVSIRLYEVMSCDSRRINVVLPERANKCLNGKIEVKRDGGSREREVKVQLKNRQGCLGLWFRSITLW